jgi:hypothetical protein
MTYLHACAELYKYVQNDSFKVGAVTEFGALIYLAILSFELEGHFDRTRRKWFLRLME